MFKEAPILRLLQVHPHSPESEASLNFCTPRTSLAYLSLALGWRCLS